MEHGDMTTVTSEIQNPGSSLDELGITCEMLFDRFRRTGNHQATDGMWNALQEFNLKIDLIDSQYPDEFGAEA